MILTIFERLVTGYDYDILESIYSLAIFIPSLAVYTRRFHDTNRSGWNILWIFLPIAGWIVSLVYLFQRGTEGENKYEF
jgi:uncharacterized membrane protein YhaH (DUF805 family)